jgi:hypothetical protein
VTIKVDMIEDSISPEKIRLTTILARYPRFIHAEVMTHRVFSRNASSSRAIPVKRLIADIRRDPAIPNYWGKNRPGMQAKEQLTGWRLWAAKKLWIGSMWLMTGIASLADRLGAHKQIVNRMIEPWSHINVVITATDWENFFALRRHEDAQPEIKILADCVHAAMQISKPKLLLPTQWHLPFVTDEDWKRLPVMIDVIKISVARCARTSYLTHDGTKPDFDKDLALYERLVGSKPLHASPAEHQATPDDLAVGAGHRATEGHEWSEWKNDHEHGNLRGWRQFRKTLDGEFVAG